MGDNITLAPNTNATFSPTTLAPTLNGTLSPTVNGTNNGTNNSTEPYPLVGPSAFLFAYLGAAMALVPANLGAVYGTARTGVGLMMMGVDNYDMVIKNIVPVVMAGVLGIYGLIVAIIIGGAIPPETANQTNFSFQEGFKLFASGVVMGLSGLSSGISIGIIGEYGIRATGQQEKLYVALLLVLGFASALGLYALIMALVLIS